jgi:FMN phosphatase YigB (HAD superfamily)
VRQRPVAGGPPFGGGHASRYASPVPSRPPSHEDRPEVVLFDLGGVLIELGGPEEFGRLIGEPDPERVWHRWLTCEWVRRYERGHCTTEVFVEGLVRDLALPIDPASFLDRFRRWPRGPFPGAADLVRSIRPGVLRACLSNTNVVHWEDQQARHDWRGLFDRCYLSHEMARVKPDPDTFLHVVADLGRPASQVVFLDDSPSNVEQARVVGLRAFRVAGVGEARGVLGALGLLEMET